MKIIISRWVPKQYAVNIFGTIWTRSLKGLTPRLLNHEKIHTAQQKELLWIPFYLIYFFEWLIRLVQFHNSEKAYRSISFEREAYGNDFNLNYLHTRIRFAQWRTTK